MARAQTLPHHGHHVARVGARSSSVAASLRAGARWPLPLLLLSCLLSGFNGFIAGSAAGAPSEVPPAAAPGQKPTLPPAARATSHWAFQPIHPVAPPQVRHAGVARGLIDRFVLARLEAAGLSPAPRAEPRALLRRVSYDLTGLPPSYEETSAFVRDPTPEAFVRVVDRLLASPRFGERWARHWLDVARFAETKDLVLLYGKDRVRPFAYTYRDYVIRAFNEDLPLDQFILDQLAAEQNAPKDQPWRLAAMGFLTLGRLFDNNPHDIYDDQIDTVSRGLLGLTVSCARCHDHKYDPISTADYYSLYGVFASSEAPIDLPAIEEPRAVSGAEGFEKSYADKRRELEEHIEKQFEEITATARRRTADYLVAAASRKAGFTETAVFFLSLSPDDLRPGLLARWRRYLHQHAQPDDPVFGPWHDLLALNDDDYPAAAIPVLERWRAAPVGLGPGQLNPRVQQALASLHPTNRAEVARAYGSVLAGAYADHQRGAAAAGRDADPARAQLAGVFTGPESPVFFPKKQTYLHMSRVPRDKYGSLVNGLDKLAAYATNAPPARAMILTDAPEPLTPRIFNRGNPNTPGPAVPRRFIRVLGGDDAHPFQHGSGRLELARAIASADNPLTSRVLANRVWMHLLVEPLVATPSDFGTRSAPPTHPELLDYLAARLTAQGWSLKRLVREIVLSHTYQQASADDPSARRVDPDNRLLWRAHRRRLEFEEMRDTLLAVSGRLDNSLGGRSGDAAGEPQNRRRTIYGLVDRQDLPQVYRAFDFASPDQSAARRPQTVVPQQALFGLNSKFVLLQADSLAASAASLPPARAITALYRLVYGRDADDEEVSRGLEFLRAAESDARTGTGGSDALSPWQEYAQVLLLANELMFLD